MTTLVLIVTCSALAAVILIRPRKPRPTGRPAGAWIAARDNRHQWTDTPRKQRP